jgi:D-alanyl-D-alanine carboxypeptidase
MEAAAILEPMKHAGRKLGAIAVTVVVLAGCAGSRGSPAASSPAASSELATSPTTPSTPTTPAANPSASASAPARPSATSSAADIQALLDEEPTTYGAPGALAVVRVGDARWAATSGIADRAGAAIMDATRFRIASITKPIVATLVLDQVAKGTLSLDDVVGTVLPGVVRATPPITVRQLLNHTSGIFDESNDGDPIADVEKLADAALRDEARAVVKRYLAGERVIASDRVFVALSEVHDRYFAPGTGYHYSNTNYQLAAMVLERKTGRPLADLLRTRIVQPLGLTHTTIAPPDLRSPELRGYGTSTTDGSLVDITDDLTFFGNGGNGGVISTADELLAIMQAIVSGRLLPAALVADMRTPARESYGLGLATYDLTCGTFYGHEGGVNGTASIALVSPDGGAGVVIALNLRSGADPRLPVLADRMLCPHV